MYIEFLWVLSLLCSISQKRWSHLWECMKIAIAEEIVSRSGEIQIMNVLNLTAEVWLWNYFWYSYKFAIFVRRQDPESSRLILSVAM
jgi:hypothetical protein